MSGKKKRKIFFTTECNKHGRESTINHEIEVRVTTPKSKKAAVSGCPACNREG